MYTLNRDPASGKWHVYFIDKSGERVRKSTKQTDKKRASLIADDLYRRYGDPTYKASNATSLQSGAAALYEHLENKGRSKETIEFYKKKLGHLYRLLGEDTSLAKVGDPKVVDGYIAERRQEGAVAYTISKELTALRMVLKVARRRGEFDKEVSQVMPVGFATKYKPRERKLTREGVWELIAELPENLGTYVAFVAATTARDAAVGRVLGKHYDGHYIKVYDFKTKRSQRAVPVTKLTRVFAEYAFHNVRPEQHIVTGYGSVRAAMTRACKRLGIPNVSPNDIRRSACHWLQLEGVPLNVIAGVMGHVDTRMLEKVYGKLDPRELQKLLQMTLEGSWKNRRQTEETEEAEERNSR